VQKRLVRKLDLERAISEVEPHPAPKAHLEQYTIPPAVAAEILYLAAYVYDDILEKRVLDLGCGTGRLAIGAAILGAKEAVGVDIDRAAVMAAKRNAMAMGMKEMTHWIVADVDVLRGHSDTVLQNPPFGVQRRKADRKFIRKALELGRAIYSLHKGGERNRGFIKKFIDKHGGRVAGIFPMNMEIPRLFDFHTKKKHIVKVDLYRIEGKVYE